MSEKRKEMMRTPLSMDTLASNANLSWHIKISTLSTNEILNHINMRSILLATYAALSTAFVPQPFSLMPTHSFLEATSNHDAKYCADHFGECSLDEMERIRDGRSEKWCCWFLSSTLLGYCAHLVLSSSSSSSSYGAALHEERITHIFSNTDGVNNPHGVQEDIEHKFLESDLTLQIGLLKDKLAPEHISHGMNPMSSTMNLPVMDGMYEESSEAFMICLTIAGLALLPQVM